MRAGKKLLINKDIVVIAVNMGSLGFLSEIKVQEAYATYERVLKGEYQVEERNFYGTLREKLKWGDSIS